MFHNENYILGLSIKHLNRPNTSLNKERQHDKPLNVSLQAGLEFNINEYERNFLPRYSYLFTYAAVNKAEENIYLNLVQELRMGGFSMGLTQKLSNVGSFNFNSFGIGVGIQFENFEFGLAYSLPFRSKAKVHSPSIFEVFVTLDFSRFKRNQRGIFKYLQTDGY